MITNWGKRQATLVIGGSATEVPTYMMVGSGSGTAVASQTALINAWDRQALTSRDCTTANKIKFTGDWNSSEVSGLQLKEFAVCGSASTTTGSIWSRTSLPNITFDGTKELRIEEFWESF